MTAPPPAPEVSRSQDGVAVGALQVVAERLGALGGLLGELRRLVLALLTQPVRHLRMSDAWEGTCSLACVEALSTWSRTGRRLALACCAFSCAFSLACSCWSGPLASWFLEECSRRSGLPSGAFAHALTVGEVTVSIVGAVRPSVTPLTVNRPRPGGWVGATHVPSY